MDQLSKLRLYLVSSDPGLVGFRTGVRVVLTLGAVCLALIVIGRWIPMHSPSYVLGMITAIQGAAQINDKTSAERAVTRVYAALGGFAVIAAIAAAGKSLALIDALLLVVVFVATYVRGFGPRWQAVGVFTFMCGVVGSFLEAPEGDLAEIAFVLVVSGVVAHLVRHYVMPERPSRDFRRVVAATISLSEQLRRMIGTSKRTRPDSRWKDALLVMQGLKRDIRMCQNYLPMQVEGPGAGQVRTVTQRLLDLQLASETALDQASTDAMLRPGADRERLEQKLNDMKEAEERLAAAVAELPATFPEGQGHASPKPGSQPSPVPGKWFKDEQFHLAIQVTLACALAIVGGRMISSERWFWAVLTAFLVFMNTQSGEAVAVRGANRAMGTLAGIVLGIGLATLVSGDLYLTIPLAAVSVFGAYYLTRISYAGMNVCINVAISLIYGLVGIFTPKLLVLRLEETAIGAAAAIFTALAVLPVRTARTGGQAMNRLLLSLGRLLEAILEGGDDKSQRKSVTAAAGAVDAAFADVANAYAPLRGVWGVGAAGASASNSLRRAYLLTHAAHLLEHSFRQAEPAAAELQELRSIHGRLAALNKESVAADPPGSAAERRLAERQVELEIPSQPVRHAIQIMSEILTELETGGGSN
ncbi:MAG TPA: FUSC family protein [Rhizobiaceae bacterium]